MVIMGGLAFWWVRVLKIKVIFSMINPHFQDQVRFLIMIALFRDMGGFFDHTSIFDHVILLTISGDHFLTDHF